MFTMSKNNVTPSDGIGVFLKANLEDFLEILWTNTFQAGFRLMDIARWAPKNDSYKWGEMGPYKWLKINGFPWVLIVDGH